MHEKKNVYGSLLGTLMNGKWKTKDHAKTRADLEELDIRLEDMFSKSIVELG